MDQRKVLRNLLEIDLVNFAIKLGFVEREEVELSPDLIKSSLSMLYGVAAKDDEFNYQIAVLMVALLWTYTPPHNKESLRQILSPILSEIGFSPSICLMDDNYKKEGVYSPISSYYDKIKMVANDIGNQVSIGDRLYTLTGFQADLWKLMNESSLLGVSAPTSAGKSFVLYLKIIDLILNGCRNFVFIVPTLSLISQVTSDISKLLREFEISDISVLNSFEETADGFIYVVTQERAMSIFSDEGIENLDLLIVDEVQNIERVANEGGGRARILYDVLKDVKNDFEVDRIILSGPRLKNISNLGFEIFGDISEEKTSDSPPVLNLTYSVSQHNGKYYLNQYSVAFDHPLQLKIENSSVIYGLGGSQYNDKFNNYLNTIVSRLSQSVNIVFSPTSPQARKSAKEFHLFKSEDHILIPEKSVDNGLSEYIRDTVHPCYDLADYVEAGVAYHTGKTPSHIRKTLEIASVEGRLRTIFCTTTLMQGVNLPANNVVIRNPKLFTRRYGDDAKLSAYEFANLRGRAGRLLVDFIGRTVVLDESSFVEVEGLEDKRLFEDEYKELKTGYEASYLEHEGVINGALLESVRVDDSQSKHLLTHIRYMLFKYGDEGKERLKDVGLYVDEKLLSTALDDLSSLSIPRELVLKNRYWDPLDLEYLYAAYNRGDISVPKSVWDKNFSNKILNTLTYMRDYMPHYFDRYIGVENNSYLYGVSRTAESWAREVPLNKMLKARFGDDEYEGIDKDIDAEVNKIGSKVSFGLPMLLKPIADMADDEVSVISAIENGAYSNVAKYLMDRGVPRETAIHASKLLDVEEESEIPKLLSRSNIKDRFVYWELRHIEHLLT